MRDDVRAMLDRIDEMLVKGDESAWDLWAILTALRGPDSGEDSVKDVSTIPIRRVAFPLTTRACEQGGMMPPIALFTPYSKTFSTMSGTLHFSTHIACAARAIGIVDGQKVTW